MNWEKIIFSFFITLALALNAGFVIGAINTPQYPSVWILYMAIVCGLIGIVLKLIDCSPIGAISLSASLVAVLLLFGAVITGHFASTPMSIPTRTNEITDILALTSGALIANFVSILIVVTDTLLSRR